MGGPGAGLSPGASMTVREFEMTAHQAGTIEGDVPPHVPKQLIWNYDFLTDEAFHSDPLNAPSNLLSGAPDIFFSPFYGGFWVVRRFDHIRELSRQPEIFSNYPAAIPATAGRSRKMAPIELDPPQLDRYRNTLGPSLSPPRVKEMESQIRAIARELVEALAGKGGAEFVDEF